MNKDQNSAKDKNSILVNKPAGRWLRHKESFPENTNLSADEINILLNELQVYQLELEMQNDELKASYLTIDQERAKFVGLYDLAPVGYFILDYLGIVEEANQNGVDLLNISKQTILRRRFQSFIAPPSWEDFYNFLHRMQHGDGKQSAEIRLTLPSGQIVYTRMEGIAIPNIVVADIKYYITIIDVTESRNAQHILKETKERLEMTLKASATGTWTIACGSNTVFLDTHSYKIMGIKDWQFNGTIKGLIERVYPEDQLYVRHQLMSAVNGLKDIDLEFRITDEAGEIKYIAAKGHEIEMLDESNCFAGILMDITERKKMEQEAELLKNGQQKLILSATLTAQEKERNTISRALHDSVCQLLYGIRLNLESIQRSHNLKGEFKNVNAMLDQAIKETRDLSYELTPSVLKDFGFAAGTKEMAQRTSTPDFQIDTFIDEDADLLHPDVQLYIFRMIQELINNCIKHAHATRAEIKVSLQNEHVLVRVTDNGRGFSKDTEEASRTGSGLSGIRNRVYLLNGKIKFNSTKKGLVVTITFSKVPEISA
ncbi:PAS domain-containing protein [Pedobacter sp. L105]|uniref:PAS domain-containing sensor histidine kinase n=1 Tax=Pedobacter sp. L105 TaxID=1641871 RepID=UPI00131C7816|nr:PAS domain-containing protein [Pedobacter sp. L105]